MINNVSVNRAQPKYVASGPAARKAKWAAVHSAIASEWLCGDDSFAKYVAAQFSRASLTRAGEQALAQTIEAACASLGQLVFSRTEGIAALLSGCGKLPNEGVPEIILSKPESYLSEQEILELRERYSGALERLKGLTDPPALACVAEIGLSNLCIYEVAGQVKRQTGNSDLSAQIAAGLKAVDRAVWQLAESNLQIVPPLAALYRDRGLDLMDLVGEGNLGLRHAALKFNYRFNVPFSVYSENWIKKAVTSALHTYSRLISLAVNVSEEMWRLNAVRINLKAENGREPTATEIAAKLGTSPEKVDALLQNVPLGSVASLSAPLWDDDKGNGQILDLIEDESVPRPDRSALARKRWAEIAAVLSPRESAIVYRRLWLDQTCEEIAPDLVISKGRVVQIHNRALAKIAEFSL